MSHLKKSSEGYRRDVWQGVGVIFYAIPLIQAGLPCSRSDVGDTFAQVPSRVT